MKDTNPKSGILTALVAACAIAQAGEPATAGAPPTLAAALQAPAQPVACSAVPALSSLQQRLLARYDQGVPSLARYVWMTRSIYQLDAYETATWAMSYRAAHPPC